VFEGYTHGKNPRRKKEFAELAKTNPRAEQKLYSQVKRNIFDKLRVDISIPFEKHMELNTAKLRKLIVWEGDHEPDINVSDKCFCKSNWPKLEASLEQEIEKACDKFEAKKQAAALDIDPETGVIKNYLPTNSNGSKSQEI
jgi:hypothetical protein